MTEKEGGREVAQSEWLCPALLGADVPSRPRAQENLLGVSRLRGESQRPWAGASAQLWAGFAGGGWRCVSQEEFKDRAPRNAAPPLAKHSPPQEARAAI